MTETIPPPTAFLRPDLPEAALHGLPGEVTRTLAAVSDADPAAILLSYLTLLGNAIGPEPHLVIGGAPQPGRLFTVLVGDPGQGRKGTAQNLAVQCFTDLAWLERHESGLQSAEALVDRVADGQDPRLMITEPEFARLVRVMVNTGKLSPQLRAAYDGTVLQVTRKDRSKSQEARHHHVSLIGHITPQELAPLEPRLRSAGGLERRMLWALTYRSGEVSPHLAAAVPDQLTARTADVIAAAQTGALERTDPVSRILCIKRGVMPSMVFPVAPEVRDGWQDIRRSMPATDPEMAAMFGAAETIMYRLALIYALADKAGQMTMEHVSAALALWTFCARSAEAIFGLPAAADGNQVSRRLARKVFEALHRAYPGGLTATEIRRDVLAGNHAAKPVMEYLTEQGIAEKYQVPTGGRPAEALRLVPPRLR
jgi:hypothetical protein